MGSGLYTRCTRHGTDSNEKDYMYKGSTGFWDTTYSRNDPTSPKDQG